MTTRTVVQRRIGGLAAPAALMLLLPLAVIACRDDDGVAPAQPPMPSDAEPPPAAPEPVEDGGATSLAPPVAAPEAAASLTPQPGGGDGAPAALSSGADGGLGASYFGVEGEPLTRPLYAGRLADQVDLRYHAERVRQRRFGLRSGVVWPGLPGDFQSRDAWAVPIANVRLHSKRHLAVATTRCVVDYRYPPVYSQPVLYNHLIATGSGRASQVFRINDPRTLPGVRRSMDVRSAPSGPLQSNEFYRQRHLVDRFFDQLFPERVPVARATLPVGRWTDSSGVDLVVVYFPEEDPGVSALRPREHLSMERHEAVLREALEVRATLWPESLDFPAASSSCPRSASLAPRELEPDQHRLQMIAASAALSRLLPVLDRPLGESGSGLVQEIVARSPRLSGPSWRTRSRAVEASRVEALEWAPSGRLTVRYATTRGSREAALAGVHRGGLDDGAASRVVATVRALAGAEGARVVLVTADSHDPVVSIMVPPRSLDASAELLRRGLVQLDVSDRATLSLQPTLVRAAQQALLDGAVRGTPPVADEAYQSSIRDLDSH